MIYDIFQFIGILPFLQYIFIINTYLIQLEDETFIEKRRNGRYCSSFK